MIKVIEYPNKNGDYFSPDVLKEAYKDVIGKYVYGPEGRSLKDVAGVIEGVDVQENRVELTFRWLDTPCGNILKSIGDKVIIKEKAYGNIENGEVFNMTIDSFNVESIEVKDNKFLEEVI